jgi:DNA-binding MarR family transcriptional regulator
MPEIPPFSPTIALISIARMYEAELSDILKNVGLNARKFGLLGHIKATPSISFSELARRSKITVQSTHTAVESLIVAGLVKDAKAMPGSASTLQLTTDGQEVFARAISNVKTLDESLTGRLPQLAEALEVSLPNVLTR